MAVTQRRSCPYPYPYPYPYQGGHGGHPTQDLRVGLRNGGSVCSTLAQPEPNPDPHLITRTLTPNQVGVCVESHLRPAHNKREYLSHATNTEVHALYKSVDERMRRQLKEC